MTATEYQLMYFDHMARGGFLATDTLLARAVLARHARETGKHFIYLSETR